MSLPVTGVTKSSLSFRPFLASPARVAGAAILPATPWPPRRAAFHRRQRPGAPVQILRVPDRFSDDSSFQEPCDGLPKVRGCPRDGIDLGTTRNAGGERLAVEPVTELFGERERRPAAASELEGQIGRCPLQVGVGKYPGDQPNALGLLSRQQSAGEHQVECDLLSDRSPQQG